MLGDRRRRRVPAGALWLLHSLVRLRVGGLRAAAAREDECALLGRLRRARRAAGALRGALLAAAGEEGEVDENGELYLWAGHATCERNYSVQTSSMT